MSMIETQDPTVLYVVRLPEGGSIQTVREDAARESYAAHPGSTLWSRPFPSTVKMPWIGDGDYRFERDDDGEVLAVYIPLNLTGWGFDRHDAYKQMLRVIRDHLERQTETLLEGESK